MPRRLVLTSLAVALLLYVILMQVAPLLLFRWHVPQAVYNATVLPIVGAGILGTAFLVVTWRGLRGWHRAAAAVLGAAVAIGLFLLATIPIAYLSGAALRFAVSYVGTMLYILAWSAAIVLAPWFVAGAWTERSRRRVEQARQPDAP
jgi:hypothetical protein